MDESSFYSGTLNAETYDLGIGRGGPGRTDIAFYVELARSAGHRVLELACGTGQVAIPLAEAGLEVTGLDRSVAMLRIAQAKRARLAPESRARLRFVEGDMATFALDDQFDIVIIPFRSFQALLTPDLQRSCLVRVRDHLRPGGTFALQLFDPLLDLCVPSVSSARSDAAVDPRTGNTVRVDVLRHPNDTLAQVLHETWRFTETRADGTVLRSEAEELRLRWTYRYEMRHVLELSGFEVVAEYSDFAGSPPAYGREQVWVARRMENSAWGLVSQGPGAEFGAPC